MLIVLATVIIAAQLRSQYAHWLVPPRTEPDVSQLLFNLNDQILILVIMACLLQICMLLAQRPFPKYQLQLTFFLVSAGIISLDELICWSAAIRDAVSPLAPHIYFVFKIALFLQGPLLYLYTNALIYSNFSFRGRQFLHFLPAMLFLGCLPIIYTVLGDDVIAQISEDYLVAFTHPLIKLCFWGSKLSLILYGAAAFWLLKTHTARLHAIVSNTDGVDGEWLRILVIGFLSLWVFGLSGELLSQFSFMLSFANALGLLENYIALILINALVILNFTRAKLVQQRTIEHEHEETPPSYTIEQVNRLVDSMQHRKAYLDPRLSLEKLSQITSLPQRQISIITNRHFDKNFNEFVNSYRIEHAKELLSSQRCTVLDVINASGFNSKSAFNKLFKQTTKLTPSQYRDQHVA